MYKTTKINSNLFNEIEEFIKINELDETPQSLINRLLRERFNELKYDTYIEEDLGTKKIQEKNETVVSKKRNIYGE